MGSLPKINTIYSSKNTEIDLLEEKDGLNQSEKNSSLTRVKEENTLTPEEKKELEFSIYSEKISKGIDRFREANKDQPNADIVRCVKRNIFGDKKGVENETLEMLVAVFRIQLETICGSSVEDYDRYFCTEINKKMYLENISKKITAMASDEDKEACYFQRKRLLFKIIYPEYYKENFKEIKPYELFFVGGKDKADLVRAAKPLLNKEEKENGRSLSDGAIVDRIMIKTINEAFKQAKIEDKTTIMKILSDEEKIKALMGSSSGSKNNVPGCFAVIKERKCYESYLDFYFLNLPKKDQLLLVNDYMEIRNNANIPENPLLNKLYKIYQENEQEFIDYVD